MSFSFSSIIATLKASGLSGTSLTTAVSGIASNLKSLVTPSANTAITASLTAILANSANMAVVKDETLKLAELNPPTGVANLIPALEAATTAEEVVQAVQAMETALASA